MKRLMLVLAGVAVAAAVACGAVVLWYVATPASDSADEVIVEVPKGAGVGQVARRLEQAGVVRDARAFRYYVRVRNVHREVRAGEFRFTRNMTPPEVLDVLLSGEMVRYAVTIPEGFRVTQIADVIASSQLDIERGEVLALAEDASFARELGVPADRLEGYLFPDTYEFDKTATARVVLAAMVHRWEKAWTPDLDARAAELGMTTHEVMTLASIVEKETGKAGERPVISGVFHNRLAKKMRLETDPTVIYGIEDYDGDIRYRDLRDKTNPYNTYVIRGLPPGPIASPGSAAIKAALWPADHDYFYFVSRNDGSHVFSRTYAEHTRWVRKYQLR